MVLARLAAALVAVLACAWFVIGVRQAQDIDGANSIVSASRPLAEPRLARASKLLDSAKTLNPDREVDVLRARIALLEHQPRRALRILAGVVRAEPLNLEAWLFFAQAAGVAHDPPLVRQAALKLEELYPKVG